MQNQNEFRHVSSQLKWKFSATLLVPFSNLVKRQLYSDPDINNEVMYNAVWHLYLEFKEIMAIRTHRIEHLCSSSFSLPLLEPPFQWSHCRFSLLSMSAFVVILFSWSPRRPTRTQCSLHKTQTSKKLGKQQDHLRKEKSTHHQLSISRILILPIGHTSFYQNVLL